MIYSDSETISVPENNGKQNFDKFYPNKYQNHVGCCFDYISVCADDQFSKPFWVIFRSTCCY